MIKTSRQLKDLINNLARKMRQMHSFSCGIT